jgi:hypothetical protein
MLLNEPASRPPSWLDEVRFTLLMPDRPWSTDGTLDLLSAGNEFEGWLHDRRQFETWHKQGWVSAIADLAYSTRRIGPRLKTALKPNLRKALDTADSLRADIQSKGVSELKTYLPNRLPADRAVFAAFKARWSEPSVRQAAWHDFVAACRDETIDYDKLAVHRDLFWHLMRNADYDPRRLVHLLAGVLTDVEWYLADARLWLGDITAEQFALVSPKTNG